MWLSFSTTRCAGASARASFYSIDRFVFTPSL